MKNIKTISFVVAASLVVSSCTSYNQLSAGMTGAMVGSHVGRDIGYLSSGHHFGGRSSALGSLIGAGVGAALGVGIQNSIEQSSERRQAAAQQRYEEEQYNRRSTYDYNTSSSADYQTGGGKTSYQTTRSTSGNIGIDALTYLDGDGDGNISKGETIEVETYITNRTNSRINNLTISLVTSDDRYVTLSSPLVTSLSPGQKVRYTGRVYCQKAKKNTPLNLAVSVQANGVNYSSENLSIYMR